MATPKEQKTLRSFNCKNGKYAVRKADGSKGTPVDMGFLDSVALEANVGVTAIYGDGEIQKEIVSDNSKTGNLVLTAPDTDFEVAVGIKKVGTGGEMLDVALRSKKTVDIYVEVTDETKNSAVIGKKWILGASVTPPSQTYNQNTDSPNANNWTYPLTVLGEKALEETGEEIFTDADGMEQRVYVITSKPGDDGYATFGDTVPTPRIAAETV